jgi:hypothetical protein
MGRGRKLQLLVLVAICVAAALAVAVVASGPQREATAAVSEAGLPPTGNYDTAVLPPDVRPVVFVSGTPYEMGVQYGEQARELIARNAEYLYSQILPKYGTWEAMVQQMAPYEALVVDQAPEIAEMWRGIAAGSGESYETIAMVNLELPLFVMPTDAEEPPCSHITAWGRATKDHKLIVGENLDQGFIGNYTVVLVAFPSEGNSFIMTPPWAGEVGGGFQMNNKGLAITGSGGQGAREEDMQVGFPAMAAKAHIIWTCDTAEQAKDAYVALNPNGAELAQFADASNDVYVVEHTSAASVVRRAGDYGERDYLIATNGFLSEELQGAMYPDPWNGGWYDWLPRYNTYEKLIRDNFGRIGVGSIMAFTGCHDYWDGKAWHRNVWSTKPAIDSQSCWTPEMRDIYYKCLMRAVAVPADLTAYLMQGQTDIRAGTVPQATGEFCKLVLGDGAVAVALQAQDDAQVQIWYAARNLATGRVAATASRDAKLEKAKAVFWKGLNLLAKAGVATDVNVAQARYGEAVTCFCKAQCFAEQAQGLVSNSGAVPPSPW